ncbi:MAG: DUF2277 domain-containing protein [Thermoanaerobaculia bacterium]
MCRSIKRLHNVEPPVDADEVRNASLQFVRKIAGTTRPSKANAEAFARAVDEIAAASERLLAELVAHAPPQDREAAAAKARQRWQPQA